MKRVAALSFAALGVLVLAIGAVTWRALEGGEVVIVRTRTPDGEHETRVWVADADGALWLEAGSPESAWYRHVLARPRVEIVRDGRAAPYRLTPLPGPEGQRRIRGLFRAKYGWADRWLAWLHDGSRSVLVRADPISFLREDTPDVE
jgi:hypothetical protein